MSIGLFRVLKTQAKLFMTTLCGNTDQLKMRKSCCELVKVACGQGVCLCVCVYVCVLRAGGG